MQSSWGSCIGNPFLLHENHANASFSNALAVCQALHVDTDTDVQGPGAYLDINSDRGPSKYGAFNIPVNNRSVSTFPADGATSAATLDDAPTRHLWVGKVATNVDRQALEQLFGHFGPLEYVRVFPGKAFAFVNFTSAQHAAVAKAALHGQLVPFVTCNRPLEIRYQKRQQHQQGLPQPPSISITDDLQRHILRGRDQCAASVGQKAGEMEVSAASSSLGAHGLRQFKRVSSAGSSGSASGPAVPIAAGAGEVIGTSDNGCGNGAQGSLHISPKDCDDRSERPQTRVDESQDGTTHRTGQPAEASAATNLESLLSTLNLLGIAVFGHADKGSDKGDEAPDGTSSNGTVGSGACSSSTTTTSSSIVDSASSSAFGDYDSSATSNGTAGVPSRNLWLGNVNQSTDKGTLELMFGRFGPLESVRVFPDKNYAFVNYISAKHAAAAKAALHGQQVPFVANNRPLEIRYQMRQQLTSQPPFEHGGAGAYRPSEPLPHPILTPRDYAGLHLGLTDSCNGMGNNYDAMAVVAGNMAYRIADMVSASAAGGDTAAGREAGDAGCAQNEQPGRCLWLGNIPSNVDRAALEEVFGHFGPLESVRIFADRNFAFVNYVQPEHAAAAREHLNARPVQRLTGSKPLLVRYPRVTPKPAVSGERMDNPAVVAAAALKDWLLSGTDLGNLAPAANLCNKLNPNSIHFDPELAERYSRLSKADKELLRAGLISVPGLEWMAGAAFAPTGPAPPVGSFGQLGSMAAIPPPLAQASALQPSFPPAQLSLEQAAKMLASSNAAGILGGGSVGTVQGESSLGPLLFALLQQQQQRPVPVASVAPPASMRLPSIPAPPPQGLGSTLGQNASAVGAGLGGPLPPFLQQQLLFQSQGAAPYYAAQMVQHVPHLQDSFGTALQMARMPHPAPSAPVATLGFDWSLQHGALMGQHAAGGPPQDSALAHAPMQDVLAQLQQQHPDGAAAVLAALLAQS